MDKPRSKTELDDKLNKSLEETFPASDTPSTNVQDKEAIRPIHRQPAKIDPELVKHLAEQVPDPTDGETESSDKAKPDKKE